MQLKIIWEILMCHNKEREGLGARLLVGHWLYGVSLSLDLLFVMIIAAIEGTLPGVFIMESMMDHVARSLGLDVETVKKANLYQKGQITPLGINLPYCNISTLWDREYCNCGMI